jgi:outer membrane protein assembly factor BamA
LPENSYLLANQRIVGSEKLPVEELEPFFRQKPNRRLLFLPFTPYVYFYELGKKRYAKKIDLDKQRLLEVEAYFSRLLADSSLDERDRRRLNDRRTKKTSALRERIENGNWLMRSVGEKPSVLDTAKVRETAEKMQAYLREQGFFSAQVTHARSLKGREATITYTVREQQPHNFGQVRLETTDSTVWRLLKADSLQSLVKTGSRYSEPLLEKERDRITRLLKNSGYFLFSKQFIFFSVDTTRQALTADVAIEIEVPEESRRHERFYIGEVDMTTDVGVSTNKAERKSRLYRGIRYLAFVQKYSPKLLNTRISVRPDSLYRLSDIEDTQRALLGMDMFKFVNIRPDTANFRVNPHIFASPQPSNEIALEEGINVSQAIPGPFFSVLWKNRNTFGGYEVLEIRGSGSLEAQASVIRSTDRSIYNSRLLNLNVSLTFPQIVFPLAKRFKERIGQYLPRTRLTAGYAYINRPEYNRLSFQTILAYNWTNKKHTSFNFHLTDISLLNTRRIDLGFLDYLYTLWREGGSNLYLSFRRAMVSSMSFAVTYNNPEREHPVYVRFFGESGGTSLNLLGGSFRSKNPQLFGLSYFRYLRFNAEGRYYIPTGEKSMLAMRLNMGVASQYGRQSETDQNSSLPYEKYFFAGGSSGIRAWRPRRLGPGSFARFNQQGEVDYSVEQPGEALLEANIEYRGNLFSFFDGAAFIDAGNIWTLREDPARPGAALQLNSFINQIAVGAGVGLRMNLTFLIMRCDLGLKIIDPAQPAGRHWVLQNFSARKMAINIGIGYPF